MDLRVKLLEMFQSLNHFQELAARNVALVRERFSRQKSVEELLRAFSSAVHG
jgi:hypothetical protein